MLLKWEKDVTVYRMEGAHNERTLLRFIAWENDYCINIVGICTFIRSFARFYVKLKKIFANYFVIRDNGHSRKVTPTIMMKLILAFIPRLYERVSERVRKRLTSLTSRRIEMHCIRIAKSVHDHDTVSI